MVSATVAFVVLLPSLLWLYHFTVFPFAGNFIVVTSLEPLPPPIVETKYGLIEGTHDGESREGRRFYQFRGIQYAAIEERFKASVEPKPWNGTRSAKEFGPSCYNIAAHGNENCLFLNIFTPSLMAENGSLLNVVVYIHGGSFQGGAGDNYGPNYFLDENVILITMNYRLGILGFLSTGDEASPGNYGLKDQVMALKWIQDNIHAFGGNKSAVTIMGQSAGSASVTYHLLSPMSSGLFRHAIAQSGTVLDPWAYIRKPLRYAEKLAKYLECEDISSTATIVKCLKSVPTSIIGERQLAKNVSLKFFNDPIAAFGPTIEPVIGDGTNTFLSSSPYELLAAGNFNKVPLLTGVVKEDGIYLWAAYLLFSKAADALEDRLKLQDEFNVVAPGAFYFDEKAPSDRLKAISAKVQDFYFGSEGCVLDKINTTFHQLSHLYSDRLFLASAIRFMNLYSKWATTYPYLYTFNKFVGIEFGMEELHKKYALDATHAADLDMLLSPLFGKVRKNPLHDQVSKSVAKLWASFIKDGFPSATYGSARDFPAIKPTVGLQKFYRIDVDTEISENIFADRIAFWDSLELSDNDFNNCFC